MSQQQQNPQKPTKSKEQLEKEKANTNAWQKKQQEKKKKKLEEQQQQQKPVQLDEKALEKAKRKQQKRLEREQMLKEQQLAKQGESAEPTKVQQPKNQEVKKPQVKNEGKKQQKKVQEKQTQVKQGQKQTKKQVKKGGQSSAKQQQPSTTQPSRKLSKDVTPPPIVPKPTYTQLLTLQHHIAKSYPSTSPINKAAQSRLIHKYLDQYINPNDTVLILARSDSWQPLNERCTKRVYLYPNHNEFEKNTNCQNITCTYEDVAYLMEGTITKIFVELDMVFANGTGLTEKGNENIICMANEFKIPVIGFSGTWNFNAWNFLSLSTFLNKYGEQPFEKHDIIENEQLEIIVLEIGSVIPKQISGHLENLSKIYRGCDFNSIKW